MNTTTLRFTSSVIKSTTNSHNRTSDMCRHRRLLPRTTELQGTRSTEPTKLIV